MCLFNLETASKEFSGPAFRHAWRADASLHGFGKIGQWDYLELPAYGIVPHAENWLTEASLESLLMVKCNHNK